MEELEQEIASIAAFALDKGENPKPYYWNVPEGFAFPAMYFPTPEINSRGETFFTYALEYAWYINIFAETTEKAHQIGLQVLTALKMGRNLVPLIDKDGQDTGKRLRLNDPSLKNIDTGVEQLTIEWTSRRPYAPDEAELMRIFHVVFDDKSEEAE